MIPYNTDIEDNRQEKSFGEIDEESTKRKHHKPNNPTNNEPANDKNANKEEDITQEKAHANSPIMKTAARKKKQRRKAHHKQQRKALQPSLSLKTSQKQQPTRNSRQQL